MSSLISRQTLYAKNNEIMIVRQIRRGADTVLEVKDEKHRKASC